VRILTLNYEFPPIGGGGSPVSYELGRELVALGHDVDVVTMGFDKLPAAEVVDGINVYRVPCLRRRREVCRTHEMAAFALAALPKVARLTASRGYDVNHTHFIVPTGLLARWLKTWSGLPFVVTAHGSDVPGYNPDRFGLEHRLLGPVWKWILRGADHVISPSRPHGRPVSIIPNGFRYERFRADRPKERRILLVSRMLPRKGVQYLLTALAGLDLRGFQVDVVGDGPYLPTVKQMASELGLPVRFWGWLDNGSAELKALYERSAIFAFTSEAENFPIVLLEAMAAGQAIVTCDSTGCPEVVGDAALLVPPRRPDRLGQALSRLVQDEDLRAQLGRRARARVEQEFGWEAIARRHVDLYHKLSQRHVARGAWGSWVRAPACSARGHGSAVIGSRAPHRPR
jgi:glycosyltransferase involved in cell wall biosynthesis